MLIPLTYIELSRPRDLIKASLNLIIGMLLLVKNNIFDRLFSSILITLTILLTFYLIEIDFDELLLDSELKQGYHFLDKNL